ncbi:MAG: glycosyltransferase family 4 protein [Parcubacteria group bacterium]|nr:glycosyltransferase family 4 protein [Parcubacteria group bacterium]
MKTLFITRTYPPVTGGMENLSYQVTSNFSKIADAFIIANKRGKKNLPFFIPWALIKGLIIARKVDVVHIGDPVLSIVGWVIKKLSKKPVAVTLHGLDITYQSKIYQSYIKYFGKKFDQYICISRQTETEAKNNGFPNTVIVPIGIDLPEAVERSRGDLEKILKTDLSQKKVLLTVGRLVKRKGVQWFIENVLPGLEKNVIYVIVGDGEDKEKILQAADKQKVADRIFALGRVSDDELRIIYSNSDIFIMPNIKVPGDMEGFGIVALEAAAHELPVVASDMEGIKDAIQHKGNGLLVKSQDIAQYLQVINGLLTDDNTRVQFGRQARQFVKDNYSWGTIVQKYQQVFQDLIPKS